MLEVIFKFPGPYYHENKNVWKKAREEYSLGEPLEFMGFQNMGWKSRKEEIKVDAVRDIDPKTGREFSKETTIVWRGEEPTWLLGWMREHWSEFELNPLREKLKKFDEDTQRQVKSWKESLNRPPDAYINAYLKDRAAKRQEMEKVVSVPMPEKKELGISIEELEGLENGANKN